MSTRKNFRFAAGIGAVVASLGLAPATARALTLTWDVDSAASSIQLTVPDQTVHVTHNNIGDIKILMRDPSNDSQWTEAGGRRAYIDGTITTPYVDSTSITFLSGSNNLYALEQANLRPNPADWNAAALSYTNTRTAPAGLGARVRGNYIIIFTFDIAYLALRDIRFDIAGGSLPITGGAFPGGQTRLAISSAVGDVDGLELPLSLGQPVPDLWRESLTPIVGTNSSGGTVQDLGGRNRKLTYTINLPSISIDLQGTMLTGSAAGQIVAYATLPEPPPLRIALATNATVVVAWPATVTGFLLERNSALDTTNWVTVTNSPVTVGTEKQVTLPASDGGAFYRLRSQ